MGQPEQKKSDEIREALGQVHLTPTPEQEWQLCLYYQMLVEKNKVMNLTAITQWDAVLEKHFADSLAPGLWEDFPKKGTLLDLGTGAGFPGIPLKIMFPALEVTLADALRKRITFLEEVTEALGLQGVHLVHGRAEDLARMKEYRETFDLCVSRAVAGLPVLLEYCLPFVKIGGSLLSYKGGEPEKELKEGEHALQVLGGKAKQPLFYSLTGPEAIHHSLLVITKEKGTPGIYPRTAGKPGKEPL